jgi:hypothetical protein
MLMRLLKGMRDLLLFLTNRTDQLSNLPDAAAKHKKTNADNRMMMKM